MLINPLYGFNNRECAIGNIAFAYEVGNRNSNKGNESRKGKGETEGGEGEGKGDKRI